MSYLSAPVFLFIPPLATRSPVKHVAAHSLLALVAFVLLPAAAPLNAQVASDLKMTSSEVDSGQATSTTESHARHMLSASFAHLAHELPANCLHGSPLGSSDGFSAETGDAAGAPSFFATGEFAGGTADGASGPSNTFTVGSGPIAGAISGFKAAWNRGDWDLYLSGYAWHLPGSYTAARRSKLNSTTWGGGFGRSIGDDQGNRHLIFVMGTQDSHYKPEYFAAYCWQHPLIPDSPVQLDFGISAFLFSRVDVEDGIPLPGLLPYLAVGSKRTQLIMLYVPPIGDLIGGQTVYFFARVLL